MAEHNHEKIWRIFDLVLAAPTSERDALLARECGTDAELKKRLQAMIAAAEDPQFLASPTLARTAAMAALRKTASRDTTDLSGTRLGPYKLLQRIGEGGFGTVWLAEQDAPVRRKVALKVIAPGMDSKQVIGRFEAERQALALMEHPHIARIFDGGLTADSRPYFVMEYVVGDIITAFVDAHKLSLPERLELFQQVCHAVQHAHTKGIIHRDLKPGNILVSMVDGRPFAKVIDFGIAKATGASGGRLSDKSFFTEHRQLMGTPEYMSPEQAEGSADIDTKTDVYALGVLLYELLTGATPFDSKRLRSAAIGEIQRIIKEEEPPMPSLRLSRGVGGLDTLASTAALRRVEPGRLSALVKGELDWIVMKALEKERARRYETATALAADVGHHLAGAPVVAAPPSTAYRVRKFIRRNKGPVIAGTAIAATLLVRIAGTTWQWRASQRANDRMRETLAFTQKHVGKLWAQQSTWSSGAPGIIQHGDPDGGVGYAFSFTEEDGKRVPRFEPLPGQDDNSLTKGLVYDLFITGFETYQRLQKERDQLAHQRDTAEEALSEMFLASTGTNGGMNAGLPVIPDIRGKPGYKLTPFLDSSEPASHGGKFRFGMQSAVEGAAIEPLPEHLLLPALADSARATLSKAIEIADANEWSAYTANLALAQAAMDAGNYPEARTRLANCPNSKRGWEWELQRSLAYRIDRFIPTSDTMAAISHDGRWIACGASSRGSVQDTITIYDAMTGKKRSQHKLDVQVSVKQFVGENPWLLTSMGTNRSGDHNVRIYDITANAWHAILKHDAGEVTCASASEDGRLVIAGHEAGRVTIWELDGNTAPSTFQVADGDIWDAKLSPDGKNFIVSSKDKAVTIHNAITGTRVAECEGVLTYYYTLAIDSERNWIVGVSNWGPIQVWDGTTGRLIASPYTQIHRGKFYGDIAYNDNMLFSDGGTYWGQRGLQVLPYVPLGDITWRQGIVHKVKLTNMNSELAVAVTGDYGINVPTGVLFMSPEQIPSPERFIQSDELTIPAILASCPQPPLTGLSILTPDGTRRIVAGGAGADRTVRFYEVKGGPGAPKPLANAEDGGGVGVGSPRTSAPGGRADPTTSTPSTSVSSSSSSPPQAPISESPAVGVVEKAGSGRLAPPEPTYVEYPSRREGLPERELAVFTLDEAITNLHMTGDGTRLIIELADGSARVWDIRPAAERRADLQREWAERVPAGEYLDGLWDATKPVEAMPGQAEAAAAIREWPTPANAAPTPPTTPKIPTDQLRDAIINDPSLTPLRRLVAVQLLAERMEELDQAVREAFEKLTDGQTDKAAVQAAAQATDLPMRVKAKVMSMAAGWEYKPKEASAEKRLADEVKRREQAESDAKQLGQALLAEVDRSLEASNSGLAFSKDAPALFAHAAQTLHQAFGSAHPRTRQARAWAVIAPLHDEDEWVMQLDRVRLAIDAYAEVGDPQEWDRMIYSVSNALIPRYRLSMEWLDRLSRDSDSKAYRITHGGLSSSMALAGR